MIKSRSFSLIKGKIRRTKHYKVCIVGGGPVGLVCSSLLSNYGVNHCLVEKKSNPTNHPQAHYMNNRTMEILRDCIPSAFEAVIGQMSNSAMWRDFSYCYSLTRAEFARTDHFSSIMTPSQFWLESPTSIAHLPQNKFENILRNALQSSFSSSCQPYIGYEASRISLKHENNNDRHHLHLNRIHTTTNTRNNDSNSGGSISNSSSNMPDSQVDITCDYLIAADGAHSSIRKALKVDYLGTEGIQHLVNIHFRCPSLYARLKGRPAMLYFIYNEKTVAVLVAHAPQDDEWVAQVPFFPPFQSIKDFTHDKVIGILEACVGFSLKDIAATNMANGKGSLEILSVNSWCMSAQVAERFTDQGSTIKAATTTASSRGGGSKDCSVFLIGDAAHRFPPAGGFGMNTGIQDAHNLAWKLALVCNESASAGLLETYDTERRQVAQENTAFSLRNYQVSVNAASTLGADADDVNKATRLVGGLFQKTESFLPSTLRSGLVSAGITAGLAPLACLRNPTTNVIGKHRVLQLQRMAEQGRLLRLIFPSEDLFFQYKAGAIVLNKTRNKTPRNISSTRLHPKQFDKHRSQICIGGRIPHCWLQVASPQRARVDDTTDSLPEVNNQLISSVSIPAVVSKLLFVSDSRDSPKRLFECAYFSLLVPFSSMSNWEEVLKKMSSLASSRMDKIVLVGIDSPLSNNQLLQHSDLQNRLQRPRHVEFSADSNNQHATDALKSMITYTSSSPSDGRIVLIDVTGEWNQRMNQLDSEIDGVLLRPDGHIASLISGINEEQLMKELKQLYLL